MICSELPTQQHFTNIEFILAIKLYRSALEIETSHINVLILIRSRCYIVTRCTNLVSVHYFLPLGICPKGGVTSSSCGQSSLKFEGPELTQVFPNLNKVMRRTSLGQGRRILAVVVDPTKEYCMGVTHGYNLIRVNSDQ